MSERIAREWGNELALLNMTGTSRGGGSKKNYYVVGIHDGGKNDRKETGRKFIL